jgi:hypothetical protein
MEDDEEETGMEEGQTDEVDTWNQAVVDKGLSASPSASPPRGRSLIGSKVAFLDEDCGWCVGVVTRKSHGKGEHEYKIAFDSDGDETRSLSPHSFRAGIERLEDAPPGSWLVVLPLLSHPP